MRRQRAPTEREVAGGGAAIEGYRVGWLRSQLGLVRQEPVHFADSVAYNIGYGTAGTDKPYMDVGTAARAAAGAAGSLRDFCLPRAVVHAARDASAHDFIMRLKHGFATQCRAGGGRLSGGQK